MLTPTTGLSLVTQIEYPFQYLNNVCQVSGVIMVAGVTVISLSAPDTDPVTVVTTHEWTAAQ